MDGRAVVRFGREPVLPCLSAGLLLCTVITVGCSQKGLVIYAPPEFAGGAIAVNGNVVASLRKEQRGYRWVGWRKSAEEFGLPPRSECRGEIRLSPGEYTIAVFQNGYAPIARRFRYDGKRPESLDLASEFVTPIVVFADRLVEADVTADLAREFGNGLDAVTKRDFRRAAEIFEGVVSHQRDAAAELNLALCLWNLGERRRSIGIIEDVRRRDSSFWLATYDEGVLLLEENQIGAAKALAEQLQRLQPKNPAYVRLASALVSRSGG